PLRNNPLVGFTYTWVGTEALPLVTVPHCRSFRQPFTSKPNTSCGTTDTPSFRYPLKPAATTVLSHRSQFRASEPYPTPAPTEKPCRFCGRCARAVPAPQLVSATPATNTRVAAGM